MHVPANDRQQPGAVYKYWAGSVCAVCLDTHCRCLPLLVLATSRKGLFTVHDPSSPTHWLSFGREERVMLKPRAPRSSSHRGERWHANRSFVPCDRGRRLRKSFQSQVGAQASRVIELKRTMREDRLTYSRGRSGVLAVRSAGQPANALFTRSGASSNQWKPQDSNNAA